jgi:hypothetical protein
MILIKSRYHIQRPRHLSGITLIRYVQEQKIGKLNEKKVFGRKNNKRAKTG